MLRWAVGRNLVQPGVRQLDFVSVGHVDRSPVESRLYYVVLRLGVYGLTEGITTAELLNLHCCLKKCSNHLKPSCFNTSWPQ